MGVTKEGIDLIYISESLLYICFSILFGGLLTSVIPSGKQTDIRLPEWLLPVGVCGIVLCSFIPVWEIVRSVAGDSSYGFGDVLYRVIFAFEIGKAWLLMLGFSLLLLVLLTVRRRLNNRYFSYMGLIVSTILILIVSWVGHASSYSGIGGFISHSTHFLAVSVWLGILLVTGWFGQRWSGWSIFLRWFRPLAIICVAIIVISGLILTQYLAPEYIRSFILPYGQAMLIKHLLLFPLLIYALINGFLMHRRLSENPSFDPRSWFRAESIVGLFVFAATAFMNQQGPPHVVRETLKTEPPASWVSWKEQSIANGLDLTYTGTSLVLMSIAGILLALIVLSFLKNKPVILSMLMSGMFLIVTYFSVMLSIQ